MGAKILVVLLLAGIVTAGYCCLIMSGRKDDEAEQKAKGKDKS